MTPAISNDVNTIIQNHGIKIGPVTEFDHYDWNDLVERSSQTNVFHHRESLAVQTDHADVTVHPLVGYKGQEPIGVFPIFEKPKGWMRMALSAAPKLWVSYLGPALLNHENLKRRKRDRRTRLFVDGCLAWMERELSPIYVQVRPDSQFQDVRPFEWRGFDVEVRHTYAVDLTSGEEDMLMSFSSDARNNIRTDGDYRIYEGGTDEIETIISQVQVRHAEQGASYGVTTEFVTDLYDRLPDGAVRPYACEVDGEIAGGMVALEFGDTVYRWQGGAKHDYDLPINELVDWRIMVDAMDRDLARYDLVGANKQRLCDYKAKFGPDLRSYYRMERSSLTMDVLSTVQQKL